MGKFIEVEEQGYVWRFPLELVATSYANYYSENDPATDWEKEYHYIMNCPEDGINWFIGDMNWSDVEYAAQLIQKPTAIPRPSYESEYRYTEI